MSFEDTIRNMDYVAGEIKKIRAVISAGDVNTALKLLVGLKNSFQLESLSDMTDMGAGTSLSYVLAVDIAEKFLRANNPVQAFQVLAGNRPSTKVPDVSSERVLFDSAFFDASQGDFKKAKDSLAGVSKGSGKMILVNNQQYTLDQALAFCVQSLDAVRQSQEARRALSWLDYVKKQL
ncbi:hypothetical protein J4219_04410 [Candidatus Woesearchaeota archaeon]|nr:hypothetical protein [Candidatus Woesearchaeota archaeon]